MLDFVTRKFKENIWIRRGLYGALGAAAGYSYYYFIGCYGGTCPITGNPVISTLYGAGVGILLPGRRPRSI